MKKDQKTEAMTIIIVGRTYYVMRKHERDCLAGCLPDGWWEKMELLGSQGNTHA